MTHLQNQSKSSITKSRFDEIQKANIEILRKRVENYSSADDSDDDVEIDKKNIDALFKNYEGKRDEIDQASIKIFTFLENGENIDCLICIRQIKSKDSIWSCKICFISFHLACIQRWGNDSILQKKKSSENQPDGYYTSAGTFVHKNKISITWDCPQCRMVYEPSEVPRQYECYCGKENNPSIQPFLIPHSCGENCNKSLSCSVDGDLKNVHRCKLICHPGPHPSCAQMIQKSCACGKSSVKTVRCSQQSWSCGKQCEKLLACGVHNCQEVCHLQQNCLPCNKSRMLPCSCGSSSKEIKCDQMEWKCQKKCGKLFACNVHFCEKTCHPDGQCGNCMYFDKTCFCGKQTKTSASCETFSKESCGSTCDKPLLCSETQKTHKCMSRCHAGLCGQCMELTVKKCRCGSLTKESPCSKELQCELKCKSLKNCKKHTCNKKCCSDCLPCDKICSKPLKCGKHICGALCHVGDCYPCTKKVLSKCNCRSTSMLVNCGRKTRLPKCNLPCKIASKCHHSSIPHKCHFGDCRKCDQICSQILPNCRHLCGEKCHDLVRTVTKDKYFVAKVPGEYAEEKIVMKKLPCPACKAYIGVECIGGHTIIEMECSSAKAESCGRNCNRKLMCKNHYCKLMCHSIEHKNNEQDEYDENCEECNLPCTLDRNCSHPCLKPCHSNEKDCRRCQVLIKLKCFCGLTDVAFRCCDVYKKRLTMEESEKLKEKFMSCGSKCTKTLPCGHFCSSYCHKGVCPGADDCKKKVKLNCLCKLRRIEYKCDTIRFERITSIPCDLNCAAKKAFSEEEKIKEEAKIKAIEDDKNKKEMELFEKKFGPKKVKSRKVTVIEGKDSGFNFKLRIISSVICILLAVVLYVIFSKD